MSYSIFLPLKNVLSFYLSSILKTSKLLWSVLRSNVIFVCSELRALAELLGAYGMKHMSERMMQQVANQISELKVSSWVAIGYLLKVTYFLRHTENQRFLKVLDFSFKGWNSLKNGGFS